MKFNILQWNCVVIIEIGYFSKKGLPLLMSCNTKIDIMLVINFYLMFNESHHNIHTMQCTQFWMVFSLLSAPISGSDFRNNFVKSTRNSVSIRFSAIVKHKPISFDLLHWIGFIWIWNSTPSAISIFDFTLFFWTWNASTNSLELKSKLFALTSKWKANWDDIRVDVLNKSTNLSKKKCW